MQRERGGRIRVEQAMDARFEQARALSQRVLEDVTRRLGELVDPVEQRQRVRRALVTTRPALDSASCAPASAGPASCSVSDSSTRIIAMPSA